MKTTILIIAFFVTSLSAISQTRDSTYYVAEDSTCSQTEVTMTFSAKNTAALHRTFGANWKNEIKSIILSRIHTGDPWREYKDQWELVQNMNLTTAQKKIVLDGLGIPDPKTIKITRPVTVQVP